MSDKIKVEKRNPIELSCIAGLTRLLGLAASPAPFFGCNNRSKSSTFIRVYLPSPRESGKTKGKTPAQRESFGQRSLRNSCAPDSRTILDVGLFASPRTCASTHARRIFPSTFEPTKAPLSELSIHVEIIGRDSPPKTYIAGERNCLICTKNRFTKHVDRIKNKTKKWTQIFRDTSKYCGKTFE